jgi:hypothetical protein
VLGVLLLLGGAAWVWRNDILRTALDPRIPYQTYDPPPAPNYAARDAWALLPGVGVAGGMDVFFVHPTTYDGGEHWNAPIDHAQAVRVLQRDMLPNHAAPYHRLGRVFAPRYRQASLYTLLTLREDARDARRFAYRDVRAAFEFWRSQSDGRPFMIVGVEQGGLLATRLLAEEVAPDPDLRARLVGAHLVETLTVKGPGVAACKAPDQVGCVLAFASVEDGEGVRARRMRERALVWRGDRLEPLTVAAPLCVNPLLGAPGGAPKSANRGAANATGLEWGARPAFLRHEVGAFCREGVLYVTRPESPALQPPRRWARRLRAAPYNVFYADLEADAARRLQAWTARSAGARSALRPPVEQFAEQP